jgi:hypothetical protein
MRRFFLCLCFVLVGELVINAQNIKPAISFGLVSNFGTSIQSLGFVVQTGIVYEYWQTNIRLSGTYKWKQWGGNLATPEIQAGVGLVQAFGPVDSIRLSSDVLSNSTGYAHSVSYALQFYFDKVGTSQRTGTVGIQHNAFRVFHENDILGEFSVDKFRTAALGCTYTVQDISYGMHIILWTSSFNDPQTKKVRNDSIYPSRYGYYDVSQSKLPNQSHGICAFYIQTHKPHNQHARFAAGVDAEQIRNFVQNILIHDALLIPESLMNYENMHFPMIASDGSLYLYLENQSIRKPRLYMQMGTHQNLLY